MIDVAIIGGGPAGLSAAVNVAARNRQAVVFTGAGMESSALYKAELINNHLGMHNTNGKQMLEKFYTHAAELGIEMKKVRIQKIYEADNHFMLQAGQDIITAKTVILATGTLKKGNIVNESKYVGKGVSYCATCDGMLYRGRDVAVIADIAEGEEDANFLSEICRSVKYFPSYGAPSHIKDGVDVLHEQVTEIFGTDYVGGIKTGNGTFDVFGVFIIRAAAPINSLIDGLDTLNGAISVDRNMSTNIGGIFACGDCTGAPLQLSNAIGEGLIAGQQAVRFLQKQD